MNEVRLSGWFATEVALSESEGQGQGASFIIRVCNSSGKEDFFRVVCIGDAARVVREAVTERLLLGAPVEVVGSLSQDVDGNEDSTKTVRIVAEIGY